MSRPSAVRAQTLLARAGVGAIRTGLDQLVRRNLRGVWIRGEIPTGPAVWASNHHSWWDYFVAAAALRSAGRADIDVVMQAENIGNGALFAQAGVIGTNEIRQAVRALESGRVVVIFPEGELRVPGVLGPTRPGAPWLARTTTATLLLVSTRVVMRSHQAAEAYIDIDNTFDPTTVEYEEAHRTQLRQLDLALLTAAPADPLPGFQKIVAGVRNWDERFSTLRANP